MATYNRSHFILETLKSIQNQTYQEWECIIVDDGGTDNTEEAINDLLKQDSRFQFLKRPDKYLKGLPGSRNYGLDLAKGEYIIFFDDDDIVHPLNLEICVEELSIGQVSFCRYLRSVFIGHFDYNFDFSKEYNLFYIDRKDVGKVIKNELPLNSCSVMWKKDCFVNHRFVESLMYAEEWELYTRIMSNGFRGVSIGKTLFYGRKHEKSNTGEFWKNSPVRVNSKKDAIELVMTNLIEKKLLTTNLLRYLVNLTISFRDYNLVKNILKISKTNTKSKLFYLVKYYLYPVWVVYVRGVKFLNRDK